MSLLDSFQYSAYSFFKGIGMLNIKMDKAALTVLDLPFSPFIDLF
jgi:hypothetical protein